MLKHPELAVAAYEKGIEVGVSILRTVGVDDSRKEYRQAKEMMKLMNDRGAAIRGRKDNAHRSFAQVERMKQELSFGSF